MRRGVSLQKKTNPKRHMAMLMCLNPPDASLGGYRLDERRWSCAAHGASATARSHLLLRH
jgi:hypothetical protein